MLSMLLYGALASRPLALSDENFASSSSHDRNERQTGLTGDPVTPKLRPEMARGQRCGSLNQGSDSSPMPTAIENSRTDAKRITVSSLVSRALTDQKELLEARQAELDRWNSADQAHFFKWFGSRSLEAREVISQRIRVLMLLNQEYSVGNFRRVVPSRSGLFAFVRPDDPSKIYVDQEFVAGTFAGENSRPGTLCHEMSHFTLAGGTRDFAYGVVHCKLLARQDSRRALNNADSFEFFVEKVQ